MKIHIFRAHWVAIRLYSFIIGFGGEFQLHLVVWLNGYYCGAMVELLDRVLETYNDTIHSD